MFVNPPDLRTPALAGWSPSPAAQLTIFWRVMHLYMSRYGSVPVGQMLVGLTTIILNELGRPPTVSDLCEATGLPKSSISRYISAQMDQGVVIEKIDPEDRRRRKLVQTEAGKGERTWQVEEIRKILADVKAWDEEVAAAGGEIDAEAELEKMKAAASAEAAEPFIKRRKRGRRSLAA